MKNKNILTEGHWKNTTAFRDFVIIFTVAILVFVLAVAFEAFETFVEWSRVREKWEIDEIAIVLIILAFALGAFSLRRWRELAHEVTERKRVEEALRDSRHMLQTVLDSIPAAVFWKDRDSIYLGGNRTWLEAAGLKSSEEVIGKSDYDLPWGKKQTDSFREDDRRVMELGIPEYDIIEPYLRADGTHAWARTNKVPLRDTEGNVVGVLGTYEDITERKRAEEALRHRAEELDVLQATVLDITAPHDLPTLLQTIVERAVLLLNALSGGLYLCDPDQEETRCVVSYNTPHDYTGTVLKYGEGAAGIVAQTGEPLVIDDYRTWSGRAAVYEEEHPFTAVLGAPMIWQGQVTGVIHVLHDVETRHFTQADLELLTLFANHAAIAVENARLYETVQQELAERERVEEELRQRQLQLSVLNRMGRALAGTFELVRIYRIAYEHVAQLVDCPSFGISLYDPPTRTLRAEFMLDDGELIDVAQFPPMVMGIEPTQGRVRAIATRQPEIITDYPAVVEKATDRGVRVGVSEDEHVTGAAMYVPMVARGQVIGLLEVQSYRLNAYSVEHAALLGPVANQIGLSIQNAQLYEEAQRELAERKRAEGELRQSFEKLQRALEGTINVLVSAVEMKDPYTAGHQRRVARLACAIAQEMGLPQEQIGGIRMAGLIHDLGKITIPTEILSKPTRLSEFEWGMIKAHSQTGYDILKTIDFPWPVAQIVLQHHERMDASGYPQGLSGEEIMLEAMILAVADVVEAMASHRPYRPLRGLDKALEEISQNRGVLYDPEVVDACLKLFTEKGFEFE